MTIVFLLVWGIKVWPTSSWTGKKLSSIFFFWHHPSNQKPIIIWCVRISGIPTPDPVRQALGAQREESPAKKKKIPWQFSLPLSSSFEINHKRSTIGKKKKKNVNFELWNQTWEKRWAYAFLSCDLEPVWHVLCYKMMIDIISWSICLEISFSSPVTRDQGFPNSSNNLIY